MENEETQNEETQNQETERKDKQNEITANITGRITKVKLIAEQLISLMQRNTFSEAEITAAFDLADGIQDESEESIMLLFDLKELLQL
jgi:hypothetical protein